MREKLLATNEREASYVPNTGLMWTTHPCIQVPNDRLHYDLFLTSDLFPFIHPLVFIYCHLLLLPVFHYFIFLSFLS